jgi:prefoldin subunit 5
LEWLNNQGQFLAEIDQNIDSFQTQLQSLDSRILAINPYDAEVVVVTKKLDVSYVQMVAS